MREYFFSLIEALQGRLGGREVLLARFEGEDSDFVRLSQNRIRNAGRVAQRTITLDLVQGQRHATGSCDLSGSSAEDLDLALSLLGRLRERLPHLPEDPYLSFSRKPTDTLDVGENRLPDSAEAVAELVTLGEGLDLVGLWAAGSLYRGFANSIGQRNWHQSATFNLDWSAYLGADKAIKSGYSGFGWEPAALQGKLREMRRRLEVMARAPKTIAPGRYRAYLAPHAVRELLDMLAWGGLGLKSHRTAQSALLKLARGEKTLSPSVTLQEDNHRGLAPSFTGEGFVKPPAVTLIDAGAHAGCLVSARSGQEYGEAVNAAAEYPESLDLSAGDLTDEKALDRLGTGILIGNLWYCNFSDRNDCRLTGMTRFGTFWVENGEIQAPLSVMRFDDSIFHLLGDRLEALSAERELILSADTYGGRSTTSYQVPGALVSGMCFTL